MELIVSILVASSVLAGSSAKFEFATLQSYYLPLEKIYLHPGSNLIPSSNAKFKWKQIMGPHNLSVLSDTNPVAVITNLKMGFYVFLVKIDQFNNSSLRSRIIQINIYDSSNIKPKANAGGNVVVILPRTSVQLSGVNSFDDRKVLRYQWIADVHNPAGLEILGNSVNEPNLILCNLSPGIYKFKLLVEDLEGLQDEDKMTLTVKEDRNAKNMIEMLLSTNLQNFSHKSLKNFQSQVYLIVSKSIPNINLQIKIVRLKRDPLTGLALIVFYGIHHDRTQTRRKLIFSASSLIKLLRPVILDDINIFMFPVVQINSINCSRSCFEHGYCDFDTRKCICDPFWMNNLWNILLDKDSMASCDCNIFYVISVGSIIIITLFLLCRYILHIKILCYSFRPISITE